MWLKIRQKVVKSKNSCYIRPFIMKEEYTLVVVFNPTVAEKDLPMDKLVGWIADIGGQVKAKNHLGIKDFAYEIGGFLKGNFWELIIESEKPLKLNALNVSINRETNIIRYIILKN